MQSTTLMFDKNLIQALGITMVLVGFSILYLKIINSILKSKFWPIAMMIFCGLFVLAFSSMIHSYQNSISASITPYIITVILKFLVISHGIYYITVEIGRFQGLRNTVIELQEHEILIVLLSISLTNTMVNVHTLSWTTERLIITILFNILFIYLAVKIVFYIGEFKYYLIYAIPMLIVYTILVMLSHTYKIEHNIVSAETEVAIISALVVATVYLFALIRFQMVDSRKSVRQYELSRAERNLKSESSSFKFKDINKDIDKRLEVYNSQHDGINLNEKITDAINKRENEHMSHTSKDKDTEVVNEVDTDIVNDIANSDIGDSNVNNADVEVVNEVDSDLVNDIVNVDIEDKTLEQLEKELDIKLEKLSKENPGGSFNTKN